MEYVFLIFGTFIALNIGFGAALSEPSDVTWEHEPSITIEQVDPEQAVRDHNK